MNKLSLSMGLCFILALSSCSLLRPERERSGKAEAPLANHRDSLFGKWMHVKYDDRTHNFGMEFPQTAEPCEKAGPILDFDASGDVTLTMFCHAYDELKMPYDIRQDTLIYTTAEKDITKYGVIRKLTDNELVLTVFKNAYDPKFNKESETYREVPIDMDEFYLRVGGAE